MLSGCICRRKTAHNCRGLVLANILTEQALLESKVICAGIDRLADGLQIEAIAADGLIEAISVIDSSTFSVGVQWHAEWRYWEDDLSTALFAAFGQAAIERHQSR